MGIQRLYLAGQTSCSHFSARSPQPQEISWSRSSRASFLINRSEAPSCTAITYIVAISSLNLQGMVPFLLLASVGRNNRQFSLLSNQNIYPANSCLLPSIPTSRVVLCQSLSVVDCSRATTLRS